MSNMSYCRFHNTLNDLKDCWDNWNENLSEEETGAKEEMIKLIKDIYESEDLTNLEN